ncbi:hypothetical protein P8452_55219 [Trifolium repens]|nr:hypothetical protein P8452_55219 [Trifolium repens]
MFSNWYPHDYICGTCTISADEISFLILYHQMLYRRLIGGGAAATVAVSDGGAGRKLARFAAVIVRRCWKRLKLKQMSYVNVPCTCFLKPLTDIGAKIYAGRGIRFIPSDSQVFLFVNSKCKWYFHNCLKPSKLTGLRMNFSAYDFLQLKNSIDSMVLLRSGRLDAFLCSVNDLKVSNIVDPRGHNVCCWCEEKQIEILRKASPFLENQSQLESAKAAIVGENVDCKALKRTKLHELTNQESESSVAVRRARESSLKLHSR